MVSHIERNIMLMWYNVELHILMCRILIWFVLGMFNYQLAYVFLMAYEIYELYWSEYEDFIWK